MLLAGDADSDVSAAAEATLAHIPRASLAAFLARADTADDLRAFFATRGVEPTAGEVVDADVLALEAFFAAAAEAADAASATADPSVVTAAPALEEEDQPEHASALNKIRAMNVAQRIGVAMKGTREERAILIRDPNKIVAVAVLSSPKITDGEVEAIARMANVSEEILRMIAQTRGWMKNYAVIVALARNPKTPIALSMNLLPRLNDRDLRMLSSDRNIPDVLRITARKKIVIDK
jgi:hypothetical protein